MTQTDHLDWRFRHLEELHLNLNADINVGALLKDNSNIRRVELRRTYPEMLEKINKMLDFDSYPSMDFPNLNELQCTVNADHIDGWIEFIKNHPNLTRIRMTYSRMNEIQSQSLTTHLTNVEEMCIRHSDGELISANAMSNFISTQPKLLKLTLESHSISLNHYLANKLDAVWLISWQQQRILIERSH